MDIPSFAARVTGKPEDDISDLIANNKAAEASRWAASCAALVVVIADIGELPKKSTPLDKRKLDVGGGTLCFLETFLPLLCIQ